MPAKNLESRNKFGYKLKLKNNGVILEYFFVISGLLFLTLIFFRDILPGFSSAIIGDGHDGATFLWNFWWVKKSILELHQNPFLSDYMFFPFNMDLRLHTLILAPALATLPLQILWGPIVALNIYVLLSFVLSGLGAYLLAKFYTESRLASFLGAIIFAFNTYVFSHAYGHFNLTTTWPIPFVIYFLEKSYDTGKIRYGIFASFCYLFLVYSDLQYSIFTAIFIAIWAVWKILTAGSNKRSIFAFLRPLFLFFICTALGLYPFFSLVVLSFENSLLTPAKEALEFYSPDVLSFFIPPQGIITNSIVAYYNPTLAKISYSGPEWAAYFGLAVIILLPFVLFQLIRKREGDYIFWFAIFVIFFVLSLGPQLHFLAKNTGIILPLSYIHDLPLLNMTRVPVRIMIIAILAISILIAWLLSGISSYKRRYAIIGIFSALYLGEMFLLPVYTHTLEVPKAYAFLEEQQDHDKTNESIIEFPLFFSDRIDLAGERKTAFFYYQTVHEYKLINGYLSYTPRNFLRQYLDIPGMLFLVEPLNYGKPQKEDLKALKYFLFDKANLKYAIMHKNMLKSDEIKYLARFLVTDLYALEVYSDENISIYKMQ